MNYSEPLVSQHPWFVAVLLATVATPAGVVLGWLAPRPLDAVVALPLVLMDMWAASTPSNEAPALRIPLLLLGIVLTWLFYLVVARLVLWRLMSGAADGADSG